MPTITPGTRLHDFVDSLRKSAAEVFSQAFSAAWAVETSAEEGTLAAEVPQVCFELSVSGAVQGNAVIQMQSADAVGLAQRFLAEAVDASAELDNDRKQAVEELLRQVAGVAATAMKSQFGEVQLLVNVADAPTRPEVTAVLVASEAAGGKAHIELRLATELLASISAKAEAAASENCQVAANSQQESSQDDLERLLEVNVSLSLRFGERLLALREMLDLHSGSIVELDRQIQDPVDLLLGDKVLARGEVVVVDGSYGIRITELVQSWQGAG